jgi:hypothetical protein
MTLFEHPTWLTLLPHLYIAQGHIGINGPRHRIEVSKHAPLSVFDMVVACAYCGKDIHSVRETKRGVWTFNVSCPLDVDVKCARMQASHHLADAVREAMEGAPSPAGSLFA